MAFLGNLAVHLFGSNKKKIDNEIAKIVIANTSYPVIHSMLVDFGTPVAIKKFSQERHSPKLLAIYAISYACTEMSDRSIIVRPYHPNMTFRDDDERKIYFALFRAYDYCVRELKADFDRVSKYFAVGDITPFLSSLQKWPKLTSDRKHGLIS